MDRCSISYENDGSHKMELKHCREEDAGVYTAIAENLKGNTHCTAQLVVQECESSFSINFIGLREIVRLGRNYSQDQKIQNFIKYYMRKLLWSYSRLS